MDCFLGDIESTTLEKFNQIMEQRQKWFSETSQESVIACALNFLRSIRGETKIAKLSSKEIKLEKTSLFPSLTMEDNQRKRCLRTALNGGDRYHLQSDERMIIADQNLTRYQQCYLFIDKNRKNEIKYYIVASNDKSAKRKMVEIINKRIKRYRGLARNAISVLMAKVYNQGNTQEQVTGEVKALSSKLANVYSTGDFKAFSLTLEDNLDYAKLAMKDEGSSINLAMQKSANKITGMINQKIKQDFWNEKLNSPFPEIKQRK